MQFKKNLDESGRRRNKIWVDKGSEFYNRSMKPWLQSNDIKIYSTRNEQKSVVAERFTRTVKNKIYKSMTSISKKMYNGEINDIVDEYKNTYHRAIKTNAIGINLSTYIDLETEKNDKYPIFEVSDHVRISRYKNIFPKGYSPNWLEKNLMIKKVQNTVPRTCNRSIKVMKKDFELYVKRKGYDNSFNSWIYRKDIII